MNELISRIKFIRDNLRRLETFGPLDWESDNEGKERTYYGEWSQKVPYHDLINEVEILLSFTIMGASLSEKNQIGKNLLNYCEDKPWTRLLYTAKFPDGHEEGYIKHVSEHELKYYPDTNVALLEQTLKDSYKYSLETLRRWAENYIEDLRFIFKKTTLLPIPEEEFTTREKIRRRREEELTIDFLQEKEGNATNKQQVLILHRLGVFDLPKVASMTDLQKGRLFGALLNRNCDNTENYIRYRHAKPSDLNKKTVINTEANCIFVDELLNEIDLSKVVKM